MVGCQTTRLLSTTFSALLEEYSRKILDDIDTSGKKTAQHVQTFRAFRSKEEEDLG